jgi:pyruvate dehydrogenase E2 component (dihydrolipoamide acetyltransferase)
MPSLGADMESGTITKWLVSVGDRVQRGDVVAEIETEKANMEVEVFEDGVIEELLVPEGDRARVGAVLARIGTAAPAPRPAGTPGGEAPAPATAPSPRTGEPKRRAPRRRAGPQPPAPDALVAPAAPPPAPAHPGILESPILRRLAERSGVEVASLEGHGPGGRITRADVEGAMARPSAPAGHVRASPRARRLAEERGVDLAAVVGTGPGGAVVAGDVLGPRATRAAAPPPTSAEQRQQALRQAIANLMARSKREIPHYYLATTIDVHPALEWLEHANRERSVADRLVLAALLVKATARAVPSVPEMNGFMVDTQFEPSSGVHVGVAISMRGGGVIAPAIHDADQLALGDVMAKLRDLVTRARRGVLRSSEMNDPTITITNLGDLGVESVFGVIYPPQVALVGFGKVIERPWAHEGLLAIRPCVTATLSADHRVSDGHRGAVFLAEIDHLLQQPEEL